MAGIIAAGILGASLQNMAISIATERSDGTLKSLAGTPMPKSAYFIGKIVQVFAVTVLIIVILLAIGVLVYGVDLPSGARLVHLRLGRRAGLGGLHAARHRGVQPGQERPVGVGDGDPDRAGAAVHLRRLLPVQPAARLDADGRRALPAEVDGAGPAVGVPAGRPGRARSRPAAWELGRVALVLGIWCVVGLVLCVATFRWQDRGTALSYVLPVPAPLTAENIARAPKVLLHDHLDGGLRPQTVLELADEFGYRGLPAGDPESSGHAGSGRPRTPGRWCSTWRRSRTPSA